MKSAVSPAGERPRVVVANRADGGVFYWIGKLYGFAILVIVASLIAIAVAVYGYFSLNAPALPTWIVAWLAFRLGQHVELTAIAVGVGLVIAFGLSLLILRTPRLEAPITWVTGTLYTIPSLALFALLVPITGLTVVTAEIGLVSYTLLILIRNIIRGIRGVPADVREAAVGMGYAPRELLWRIEVPLALAVIIAGVRLATIVRHPSRALPPSRRGGPDAWPPRRRRAPRCSRPTRTRTARPAPSARRRAARRA